MSEKFPARIQAIHNRNLQHQTWRLEDGSLEIESRLIDTKGIDYKVGSGEIVPRGDAIHDISIRLVVNTEAIITAVSLEMHSTPFLTCPHILKDFEQLKGESVWRGWNTLLSERFAGAQGCRHIVDMLRAMATVIFQSWAEVEVWTPSLLDQFENTCHIFGPESDTFRELKRVAIARQNENGQEAG